MPHAALGSYLQSRSYTTLYDRVAGKQMRFLFGDKGLAGSAHPFLKKAVFLTMHLLFGSATMGIAVSLLWRYWWAHISFMVTLGVLSCWNASLHYRQTFIVERRDKAK
jgi:hypothetical protein